MIPVRGRPKEPVLMRFSVRYLGAVGDGKKGKEKEKEWVEAGRDETERRSRSAAVGCGAGLSFIPLSENLVT